MRKFTTAASMLAIVSLVATPVSAQSVLDRIVEVLKPKSATQSTTISPAAASAQSVAAITSSQQTDIDSQLQLAIEDAAIAQDRGEARQLISALVATGACATHPRAWNAMNRYHLTPKSHDLYSIGIVPMWGMKYHDFTTCLDVTRITDWSKPANNALSFRTYYVAADSGEAGDVGFTLQKTSEGTWMIQQISKW